MVLSQPNSVGKKMPYNKYDINKTLQLTVQVLTVMYIR